MTTTPFTITEATIPKTLDEPGGEDFRRMVELRNIVEVEVTGAPELLPTPELLLERWNNQEFEPRRLFLARVAEDIVARGTYEWQPEDSRSRIAFLEVEVLPEFRLSGIGTALLDILEGIAREEGRTILEAWAFHGTPGGSRVLTPPTGFGRIDRDRPEVQFFLRHGYSLEQVERISKLTFPLTGPSLEQRLADAAAHASGYRIVSWVGGVPDQWVDDIAYMHSRMSTDAPSAAVEFEEEVWNTARLRRVNDEVEASGDRLFSVAAIHEESGRVVGHSDLHVPTDTSRSANQEDTLVLEEHRGHRLGMLLKVANLIQLQRVSPETQSVTTFNAEENRPMLDVNEAVGFVPTGTMGAWKKTLLAPAG